MAGVSILTSMVSLSRLPSCGVTSLIHFWKLELLKFVYHRCSSAPDLCRIVRFRPIDAQICSVSFIHVEYDLLVTNGTMLKTVL
uniref:Uncharacterized protein n=1 Tax=Arundo donax TaxID=35708 RepID=A0A0A9GRG6_ARUDO